MFQTVRHWWTGGRGKITARLFLFEFVVVVLGVLVAQGLAGWVQQRDRIDRMERSDALAQSEMRSNYAVALVWRSATPCLNQRLAEIMRQSSRGAVASPLHVRPRVSQMAQTPLSVEDMLLVRDVKGPERSDLIDLIEDGVENFTRNARGVTANWGRLELVDATLGEVLSEDRASARAAAADIRAHLRAMTIIGSNMVDQFAAAGVTPDFGPSGFAPAKDCAAIWASGQIAPPRAVR